MKNLGYPLDERTGDFSAAQHAKQIDMINVENVRQLANTYSFPFTSLFYNILYAYKVRTHREYYIPSGIFVKRKISQKACENRRCYNVGSR